MIRIYSGDLLQIAANNRFYYTLVLDRIRFFGGQLCFVFYRTSERPMEMAEVMQEPLEGFYETVDFIWAKREKRAVRIATKLNVKMLNDGIGFFKATNTIKGKAAEWWIYDRATGEKRRVSQLSETEKLYPLHHRIDDILMVKRVEERWSPEQDPRI